MNDTATSSTGLLRSKRRRFLAIIILLSIILILLRAILPLWVQGYVNQRIDQEPSYEGRIGDVDLWLIRGAYQIEDVEIFRTNTDIEEPLFRAPLVEFSVLWSALLDGAIVSEVDLNQPEINFVDGGSQGPDQTGAGKDWVQLVRDLSPMRIDRVGVEDGIIIFHNFVSEPPVNIALGQINGEMLNLTNSEDLSETLVAEINAKGRFQQISEVNLSGALDPYSDAPTFDLNLTASEFELATIDALITAYAPFDVEGGSLELALELAANGGELNGYLKPVIQGLDVFEWKEDVQLQGDNPFVALWEGLVDITGELFENQDRDTIATRIPLEGNLENPDVGVLATLGGILRNAFVEAINARVEGSIDMNSDAE